MSMVSIDNNEIKNVWIEIRERDAGTVTVASQTFAVLNSSDATVQASANASISNNGTAAVQIFGLVDASTATLAAGSSYKVKFTYTIGQETYIDTVPIKVVETRL